MKLKNRFAALASAIFIVGSVGMAGCSNESPQEEGDAAPAIDTVVTDDEVAGAELDADFEAREVPDFELEQMDGNTFRMSEHRGEVVLINFWATWCGPCRFEIPELIEMQEDYHDEGFTVLGISTDEEGFEVVRPFAEDMGINYPLVIDQGPVSSAFGGIYALPTTFIIDRGGMIRERVLGLVTRSSLEPRLQILLSQERPE